MKKPTSYLIPVAFLAISVFQACKRELPCEGCAANNKPPLAVAGPDTVITLPTESVLLDGSKSSDPDGKISAWQWTKIYRPASFAISSISTAKAIVKDLSAGVYQFELKEINDGGASANDTVHVMADNPAINSHLLPIFFYRKENFIKVVQIKNLRCYK